MPKKVEGLVDSPSLAKHVREEGREHLEPGFDERSPMAESASILGGIRLPWRRPRAGVLLILVESGTSNLISCALSGFVTLSANLHVGSGVMVDPARQVIAKSGLPSRQVCRYGV